MKIISAQIFPTELKLKVPYTIAYENVDTAWNIFLKITTSDGVTGFGCAAPDPEVTNETKNSVTDTFKNILEPYLIGKDPLRYALHLTELKKTAAARPSALAMVDMALFDLLGKKANLPIYRLLGAYRTRIRTSITIGILPLDQTLMKAEQFIGKGFKILKLKGGKDVDEDIERINRVRENVGNKIELRFDANQGYNVEQSLKFFEATKKSRVELIEQPTPKGEPDLLRRVTNNVSIPIMADESLMNLRDAFRLAKRDLVDTVNIKLMKVGGIFEALKINSVAQAANLEAMVGCMDESALAISAGLHFALARANVIYADLDGHLDLIDDPAHGAVILKDGTLYPTDKPGLGFNIDM